MSKAHDDGEAVGFREADAADPGQPDGTSSDGPGSSTGQDADAVRVELPTRRQMRVQQAAGQDEVPVARPYREPMPGGRRDRRLQLTAQMTALRSAPGLMTFVPQAVPQDRRIADMSIEEALAARQAIAADARERAANSQAGGTDASSAVDPFAVDPEVLARQRVLAERAAELAARGRRLQAVSEQSPQQMPTPTDPTSADNLSILALPDVVHVPGGSQAVLRSPMTSHVPVVLHPPHSTAVGAATTADEDARSRIGAAPLDAGPGTDTGIEVDAETDSRTEAGIGVDAEVDAETETDSRTDAGIGVDADPGPRIGAGIDAGADTDSGTDADARMAPITARSAFGLEPLDAMTAGLGRLRRVRYIQYSLLGVGAAALATGIIMTVSSLNG